MSEEPDRDFYGVSAVTPWEAVLKCVEQLRKDGDDPEPGTTFRVLSHVTNEVEKFTIDAEGQVLPADLFPVM